MGVFNKGGKAEEKKAAENKEAKTAGAEYFDYYEDMRKTCDAAFFARNDVIHLDEKGFSYLAQKILEYLTNKQEGFQK